MLKPAGATAPLLIYLPKCTPRAHYIFAHLFEAAEIPYRCTQSRTDFDQCAGVKIWYADGLHPAAVNIPNCGFLTSETLEIIEPKVIPSGSFPMLFPQEGHPFAFDIFSACFYMLSRYEEYLPFEPDAHNRFPAHQSLAFKSGFLHLPVVDLWNNFLFSQLQKKFPQFAWKRPQFQSLFTYDLDFAFKYRGRSLAKKLGGLARDVAQGEFAQGLWRILTLVGLKKDPWDIHQRVLEQTSAAGIPTLFFLPAGNASRYDKHLSIRNRAVTKLVQSLLKASEIGLHPSYTSYRCLSKVQSQKALLESVCKKRIVRSRQHYLRLSFPQTYLNLLRAGIAEDYSMAFPEMPGFRAGTCKPFWFYDLKNEQMTSLRILPTAAMDATFENYIPFEKASAALEHYIDTTIKWGGIFIPIWHNNHLSSTRWKALHNELIERIRENQLNENCIHGNHATTL